MAISALSSNLATDTTPAWTWHEGWRGYAGNDSQSQDPVQQAIEDYSQLAGSLQSGDLTGAQSAYSNLQQLVQAYQGPSEGTNAIQNDFSALGNDLQNGGLSQAQSDFAQLQSDLQAAGSSGGQQSYAPSGQGGSYSLSFRIQENVQISVYA